MKMLIFIAYNILTSSTHYSQFRVRWNVGQTFILYYCRLLKKLGKEIKNKERALTVSNFRGGEGGRVNTYSVRLLHLILVQYDLGLEK